MRTRDRRDFKRKPETPPAPKPPVEEATPDVAIPGLREGLDLLKDSQDFEHLLEKSLKFAREVMDMDPPEGATPADKLKLMSLKKEVMASVLSAGVRVNDGALRKKEDDKVARLLKQVKAKTAEPVEPDPKEEVSVSDLFG